MTTEHDQPVEQAEDQQEGTGSEEDRLRGELEEAQESRIRALADFKNFQRRSVENEARAATSGIASVVRSILPALEQIDLAIEHAGDDPVVEGFAMARDELIRGLSDCGLTLIEPAVGDVFDPEVHDAMMRQDVADVETDHIAAVMQTGYSLGDIVIRPAKVAVGS
ncbi:MAG: nucleotide exchange factor GrpE [Phycisphaerales bacterium]|jgi:molecular chaperone GrpE|nr:nucleotide exchange factor GrpE [Phycisphaerales bacterium]